MHGQQNIKTSINVVPARGPKLKNI